MIKTNSQVVMTYKFTPRYSSRFTRLDLGKNFRSLFHCLCIAIGTVLLTGCGQEEETVSEPPLRTVQHITVSLDSNSRIRSFSGVSRAAQQASLSFKVAGTISLMNAAVGDRINESQVIAELDPAGFQLQLQQAQADLLRTEAEQRNAAGNYDRMKGLYENRGISRTELDAARAAFESTNALVSVAKRGVELARLNLSYAILKSQQDCTVAQTTADVGENVAAGQPVVEVNCGDHLEIAITVPETLIAEITPGLTGEITFDALPDKTYQGMVSEVGITNTGTAFPVTVRMSTSDQVRPGLAAQVKFALGGKESAIFLPAASIIEDEQGRFVYTLIDSDQANVGIIQRRPVEIGDLTSRGIKLISGVSSGDRVVTAGISAIRDGMQVRTN